MRRGTVVMFAGQGSQYYHMGRELYDHHPVFRETLTYCSRFLKPRLGVTLLDLLYAPRANRFEAFDQTRYTHPAIFSLNYALGQALLAEGISPTHYLGYSLGELVAWTMAGAADLEDALMLVSNIAACIEAKTQPGGMLAILAPAGSEDGAEVEIASLNYEGNYVVSGRQERIEDLHSQLKERGILCQILPIRHGFHSTLIDPIEAEAKELFRNLKVKPATTPVISSQVGRELTSKEWSADYCWDVLRKPVRFLETIQTLERKGPWVYIDAGPSGTLAAFVRQIVGREGLSTSHAVLTPFGKDLRGLEKLKAQC